jgi:hypothetical protein
MRKRDIKEISEILKIISSYCLFALSLASEAKAKYILNLSKHYRLVVVN